MTNVTTVDAKAILRVSTTEIETFLNVDTTSEIGRAVVDRTGTNIQEFANDGNRVSSGTVTHCIGQDTDTLFSVLHDNLAEFDLTVDPNDIREDETPIVDEAIGTGDGTVTVFFTDFHALRSTIDVEVAAVTQTLNTDYTVEYDNTLTVGRGIQITFVVPPVSAAAVTVSYTPESGGTLMHLQCVFTDMPFSVDGSSDDAIQVAAPYVSRDWVRVIGPVNRQKTGF